MRARRVRRSCAELRAWQLPPKLHGSRPPSASPAAPSAAPSAAASPPASYILTIRTSMHMNENPGAQLTEAATAWIIIPHSGEDTSRLW